MTTLAEVLREIAAIENRPGYEGPQITREIADARRAVSIFHLPADWLEDATVGAIGRACIKRRWRMGHAVSYPEDEPVVWLDIWADGLCYSGRAESLALAAALAWLAVLEEIRDENRI